MGQVDLYKISNGFLRYLEREMGFEPSVRRRIGSNCSEGCSVPLAIPEKLVVDQGAIVAAPIRLSTASMAMSPTVGEC